MNWDFVLPQTEITDAVQASEPAMNSEQFAAFYQRSARPLWAYLARVSGDPSLADDLMQESYVRFLCASSPGDGEVESRRYLFRIASNLLRDHWRRPGATSIDDLPENLFVAADACGQMDSQMDSWTQLAPAMARMRPRDRQLLWLAHAENYSHSEIAQITGLAMPSIRLLLFRARRKIARILERQAEPPLPHPVAKDPARNLARNPAKDLAQSLAKDWRKP